MIEGVVALKGSTKSSAFWDDLERQISAKVEAVLNAGEQERTSMVAYLRDIEEMARRECDRRRTIQVIASARRVLGDKTAVGSTDGPFAHTLGDLQSGRDIAGADY